jgi:hypothetical protein
MALNRHPLRDVTQQDIDDYARDGAVCLRNVLDKDWIDLLEPIARKVIIEKEDVGLLPTIPGRYMARCIPEYRRYLNRPLQKSLAKSCNRRKSGSFSTSSSPSPHNPMPRLCGIVTGWAGQLVGQWFRQSGFR